MLRWFKRLVWLLLALAAAGAFAIWLLLRASLPPLDGELALAGLTAPVTVQRDALGVATIDAANQLDAVRALGYVHAQERYFEMDLMRRSAAGELSELFGPIAVDMDKKRRVHQMRQRARDALATYSPADLALLHAYETGVNAGLTALDARPWPYLLLREPPRLWLSTDSLLTGYAMYFDLQGDELDRALAFARLRPALPGASFDLLTGEGTPWDAPLVGKARGDMPLPIARELDLRALPAPSARSPVLLQQAMMPGSNNFAVSGALTADGRAILADDMHLGLRAPNIWFRARLRYPQPEAPGGKVDVQGFTLPGLPAVIVGSNGHVAWGFTNGYVGNVAVHTACTSEAGFDDLCQQLEQRLVHETEDEIRVKGAAPVELPLREASGMPQLGKLHDGAGLFVDWSAYAPGALSFDLRRMASLTSLDNLQDDPIGGIPAQNMLVTASDGRAAWFLSGNLQQRDPSCDALATSIFGPMPPAVRRQPPPAPVAQTEAGRAVLPSAGVRIDHGHGCRLLGATRLRHPMLVAPPSGRLWTANNRTLDGLALQQVGNGGYDLGARARQIRDGLFARQRFTEKDLLAIQLDDRALFLQRWWQLMREQAARGGTPAMRALADASPRWEGRAANDAVSYRIVRAWRNAVHARIVDGLTAPAQVALGDAFALPKLPQLEGLAWPLVTQRPAHLLSRRYATWDALFEDAARQVRDDLRTHGALDLRTWGERNTAAICHPLAKAIPLLGTRLLCMPPDQLPGDSNMPRVAAPAFGASQRMVVSPGHEADGIIQMPGGQSGHFMSPFWGAGHDDWVHGRPVPFLPGITRHTLRLSPAAQ